MWYMYSAVPLASEYRAVKITKLQAATGEGLRK